MPQRWARLLCCAAPARNRRVRWRHLRPLPTVAWQLPGQPVVTQSPRMLARYGTGSVAEAAALAAAGPHSALSVTRLVADDGSATLALAFGQAGPLNCCLALAGKACNPQEQTA